MHTVASARHRPSSAPHARTPAPFGARLYGGLLALVAVAALAGWFMLYPLDRVMAGALLAGYGLLVVLRPASWLILVPALWPVVDLAPWSGHFHVTESDALILATLAALGVREALAPPPVTLSGRAPVKLTLPALVLFGLLAASVVISGLRGLYPLPPLDAAALVSYSSSLNALRVGKGFVLAFALIPFLHLAIRRDGDAALERLTRGMMLGLGTCALAALWERLAFPGLTDFANDYRTTALFWEMHVGGAALDAWLMLCFPFAVLALSQARSAPGRALALLVLGIGSYALFTTFSRIVYAALVVSLSLLGVLALMRPASASTTPRRPGVLVALIAVALLGCGLTFPEGGYRALLAFVGALLLAYMGGGAAAGMRIRQLLAAVVAGTLLLTISVPAALWLPKGVYLIYALSWAITAGLLAVRARRHDTAPSLAVVALLIWTTLNVISISAFWSEPTRFTGTAVAALLVLVVLAVQALAKKPLWSPTAHDLYGALAVLALGAMLTTTLGSYYMSGRVAATGDDIDVRLKHYANSLGLMHTSGDTLAGIGLGRYPDAYFWAIDDPGVPGSLSLLQDSQGRFLRLGSARGVRHGDEVLTLSQRIPIDTANPVRYRFRARGETGAVLQFSLCRKHLLYPEGCTFGSANLKGGAAWQTIEGAFADPLGGPGQPPRLAAFSITNKSRTPIDLDGFELLDARLEPLLKNGEFERGMDFWFFTSDRDHLPWHAKNLFVHTYVEQGALGLGVLLLALATACVRLLRQPTRLQTHAATLLAALVGVTTVGLVDSLLDMPRITLFLTLLLWLGLTLRRPENSAFRHEPASGQ